MPFAARACHARLARLTRARRTRFGRRTARVQGWFYIAVTEKLLGISLSSDSFSVTPALSDKFPSYRAVFRFRGTEYTVTAGIGDRNRWKLDGEYVNNLFYFDNRRHLLEITVEKKHGMS